MNIDNEESVIKGILDEFFQNKTNNPKYKKIFGDNKSDEAIKELAKYFFKSLYESFSNHDHAHSQLDEIVCIYFVLKFIEKYQEKTNEEEMYNILKELKYTGGLVISPDEYYKKHNGKLDYANGMKKAYNGLLITLSNKNNISLDSLNKHIDARINEFDLLRNNKRKN